MDSTTGIYGSQDYRRIQNYKFIAMAKIKSAELLPDNQKKLPWQHNNQYVYWGSLISYLDETLNVDSEEDTLVSSTAVQHDTVLIRSSDTVQPLSSYLLLLLSVLKFCDYLPYVS